MMSPHVLIVLSFIKARLRNITTFLALVSTHVAVEKDIRKTSKISYYAIVGILALISILGSSPEYF